MESEYLLQKLHKLGGQPEVDFILLPGNVSTPFADVYKDFFKHRKINIINSNEEIVTSLSTLAYTANTYIPISLAHTFYLPRSHISNSDISREETCRIGIEGITQARLKQYTQNNANTMARANEFSNNYYEMEAETSLPKVELGLVSKLLPQVKDHKVALINIRTHSANGSFGSKFESYKPLIAYLRQQEYLIIDVGHETKGFKDELEAAGVIAYWSIAEKSFYTDMELFSLADVYIGSGGISHLALAYRIPTLWVATLFPFLTPGYNSLQIPCRLRTRLTSQALDIDSSLSVYLDSPEPWDHFYDDFSGKWGPGNPNNCVTRLRKDFFIDHPSGQNILDAFRELELMNSSRTLRSHHFTVYKHRDQNGVNYKSMKIANTF